LEEVWLLSLRTIHGRSKGKYWARLFSKTSKCNWWSQSRSWPWRE
jgi:hypothetical protein